MSRFVWNFLGGCTVVSGFLLLTMRNEQATQLPPDQQGTSILFLVLFEALLALIAISCFFPKSHPVTLRVIGVLGVVSCGFNLVQGFRQRDFSYYPMNLFWLAPCLYLIWRGDLGNSALEKK
ncbi:MAG: hypothetical protein VKJ64_11565 [Leptolyngbyaceae bacterium]|nr:hypothetical protein [Leptolyngbyaceae bacterium]